MPAKYRILSIDGGGVRGIFPARIITHIEKMLQRIYRDPGYRIADYFDFFAGTSTGGILVCLYLCSDGVKPTYSADDVLNFYFDRGGDIFRIPVYHRIKSAGGILDEKYPADGLEHALGDYFGDMKLSGLLKPTVITCYDIRSRQAFFFKQHKAKLFKGRDFFLRDVTRAATAAPTYFELANIRSGTQVPYALIDGGIIANNPTMCAYAEARKVFVKPRFRRKKASAEDFAILSIGTGYSKKEYDYNKVKDWGLIEWIKPMIDMMMDGVSDTVDYQVTQIFDSVDASEQYLRIDSALTPEINPDFDCVIPENLIC